MAQSLHVSIADAVFSEIESRMATNGQKNRSEYVEELIRAGLSQSEVKNAEAN